jgi:hypothetical protein
MPTFPPVPADLAWRSSRTCDGGACVMLARQGDSVMFGNTSHPEGPVYIYTQAEWNEFLIGAKRGDFDDLPQ